ncbi:MAG TPA: phosphotransferase [Roseiflexaceae bacterium]|nr:phosphotransferase [Roseiflexaceae bacterium]
MLDTTLATEFIPGTNLKGEVAGANWSFLLPSLDLERIVCFGALPASGSFARLLNLARLCGELVVICADARMAQALDDAARQQGLTNVRSISLGGTAGLADNSVELALISGSGDARRLERDRALQLELRRILKPDGLIYFERRGLPAQLRGEPRRLAELFGAPRLYWLTPLAGEMRTAVPARDQATMRYFLRNGLSSRSLDLGVLKRAVRSFSGRSRSQASLKAASPALQSQPGRRAGLPARLKRASRTTLAALWQRTQGLLDSADYGMNGSSALGRFVRRYGVLVGRGAASAGDAPPAYLRNIANAAGVSIDTHRWGLSARGEYRSRKVLFFLFNGAAETPEYIVKMTRDPALNPRLENEYRALAWLAEHQIGDQETLPRAVFHGHHNELAIVGETVIDGVPFEQRSSGAAGCPLAGAAIDWLTELGATTADTAAVSSHQAAEALGTLFERFAQIYQLAPEQHAFLASQIAAIGGSPSRFPLVFQHGDPGSWNIWVTPSQRAAFLDWEAAEPQGMPLWDLFYFVRTYGSWAMRAGSSGDVMKGFVGQFLSASPFQQLLVDATERYRARVGVSVEFVEPLFYTCWMHRALKEATRLAAGNLDRGQYISVLRACIERQEVVRLLFGGIRNATSEATPIESPKLANVGN